MRERQETGEKLSSSNDEPELQAAFAFFRKACSNRLNPRLKTLILTQPMQSFTGEILVVYKNICRGFQLTPQHVLQAFADALSVQYFIAPQIGTAVHCAAQVFSAFVDAYPPVFPLDLLKRRQGVKHLRQLIKVKMSALGSKEKEKACKQICSQWFRVNQVTGEGQTLWIDESLSITQPEGLLLLCDVFRCRIEDALHFFIEEVILGVEQPLTEAPAFQFLLHCVSQYHSIKDN